MKHAPGARLDNAQLKLNMKNILEIPQNAETAIVIIRASKGEIICAPVAGDARELEALALLFGCFVSCIQNIEEREAATAGKPGSTYDLIQALRDCFKDNELEDIRAVLTNAAILETLK